MRAYILAITLAVILGVAVTALASGSTASINLNANPVITYSISTGTYRENITIANYTALMLQSIEYDMEHRISLNQTQLSFLAFLQALANQPTSKPSIVNVTIVSTGAQPMGPYVSYEVFLINATLSSPAPTLLVYTETAYYVPSIPGSTGPFYLVALPGTKFATAYVVFMETQSAPCTSTFLYYEMTYILQLPILWSIGGVAWTNACTNSPYYYPLSMVVNINGVNYTLTFKPYQGTSMTYPPYPNTLKLNITAYTGGIGVYDVPFTTPLALCGMKGLVARIGYLPCSGGGVFIGGIPPNYTMVFPAYLSYVIYNTMPIILMYPTQPGLYMFYNQYAIPPSLTSLMNAPLQIYANVTGPTVVPRELFSVSLPYGACSAWGASVNASPLQLSGVANYGYLAKVGGAEFTQSAWAGFSGWAAGYNTSEPGFASAALSACDNRGFWALTPVTLNMTLTDEYGYLVGYGLVTFGPNYSAWLVIVLAISAIGSDIYILVTKLRGGRGRGEVVIRL
jgi:hypothetical protein